MKKVLLVIDLQNDYFPGGKFPLWNTDKTLENIVKAITKANSKGIPVVHIQHIADPKAGIAPFFNEGTEGVAIKAEVLEVGIPTIEDRIVQQSVVNVMQPKFENEIFHKWSCGYREGLGAERVLQIILWNLETGYNHVYDCDIKGFFDNIPHKKLMKVLAKYVADGTVLDMTWKWLKAGYMEDKSYHDTNTGTPQGGVISPLLANIYLNELDWELEKESIRFVRYADDFLLFAKTEEDIKKAGQIAQKVIESLGLELSMEKTKFVDFDKDDFNFIGFTFSHWRNRKDGSGKYFIVMPTEQSLKDYKAKIKSKTIKSWTLSKEAWLKQVNPIIRGKVNYYLNIHKAIEANKKYGQQSRCFIKVIGRQLHEIDAYIRRRLRVAMLHKNPNQRRGWLMTSKWNNEYFARIGLIPGNWLFYNKMWGYELEAYIEREKEKMSRKIARRIGKAKEQGKEYYTPSRIKQMNATQAYV